uniref:Uncharacterized protein n=1 Tax=Anguilla anguilla TaxID=7936 RepID=A0A0E9RY28_ANGAN
MRTQKHPIIYFCLFDKIEQSKLMNWHWKTHKASLACNQQTVSMVDVSQGHRGPCNKNLNGVKWKTDNSWFR